MQLLSLLLATSANLYAVDGVQCFQGQSGFDEKREVIVLDCPQRFTFCLRRTFYTSEISRFKNPVFYSCSNKPECPEAGVHKQSFNQNTTIVNECCSMDLCNSSGTIYSLAGLTCVLAWIQLFIL